MARATNPAISIAGTGAAAGASANLKETVIRLQPQAFRLTSCTASVRRSKPGRLAYEYVRRPALPLGLWAPAKQAGTACLRVRKASRLSSSAAGVREASRDGLPTSK
jgi:hypothetical protein